jgi:holo-[acyl-carrier protein] synthase
MILGLGLDVVAVERLEHLLGGPHGLRFQQRVFTEKEQAYCQSRVTRILHFAARFAAKEAFAKAIGIPTGLAWTDVEVSSGGAPSFEMSDHAKSVLAARKVKRIHLTLSHDGGLAAAVVVLEG